MQPSDERHIAATRMRAAGPVVGLAWPVATLLAGAIFSVAGSEAAARRAVAAGAPTTNLIGMVAGWLVAAAAWSVGGRVMAAAARGDWSRFWRTYLAVAAICGAIGLLTHSG